MAGAVGPRVDEWADSARRAAEAAGSLPEFRDWLGRRAGGEIDVGTAAAILGQALLAAYLAGRDSAEPVALGQDEGGARLAFGEQIRFFRRKLNLSSDAWTDIWRSQHDAAFVVAGAAKAELVGDLRGAVDAAIAGGETLASFRARFDGIVEQHGWSHKGGRDWRTRVIYGANLRTSYAAGRYEQMKEAAGERPYWRYRHSDASESPRLDRQSWDGLVLRHDDPWWDTHYPPNGWGCKCFVESLSERDMERLGKDGPDAAPPLDEQLVMQDSRVLLVPQGIDPGWAYAPGQSVAQLRHQAAFRESIDESLWRDWLEGAAPTRRHAPQLTPAELLAVRYWTGAGSGAVQTPLRGMVPPGGARGTWPDGRYTAFALTLRDALAKLPRHAGGALYRGVQHIPNLDDWRPGATVSANDFWATSYGEGVANRFGGSAGVHFTIVGRSGRHIEALSVNPAEREVLMDAYTRYRVVSRDEIQLRDGRTRYEIEVHEVE